MDLTIRTNTGETRRNKKRTKNAPLRPMASIQRKDTTRKGVTRTLWACMYTKELKGVRKRKREKESSTCKKGQTNLPGLVNKFSVQHGESRTSKRDTRVRNHTSLEREEGRTSNRTKRSTRVPPCLHCTTYRCRVRHDEGEA